MIFKGPLDHRPPVSEADIQAYTDGSIAGERAAGVRRYLAARPAEWRRILFYRRLNRQIRHSFDGGATAAPGRTGPVARSAVRRGGRRRAVMAVALAALLAAAAAGGTAGWLAVTAPSRQMLDDAAVMALTEAAAAPPGEPARSVDGAPAPFGLQAAGLHLVASDTLELGPFASARRYVYENGDGQKIVLLGARAGLAKDRPQWGARRVGALRLIGWTAHGTRWVLAGDAQTHGLMRAADIATMPPPGAGRGRRNDEEQADEAGHGHP